MNGAGFYKPDALLVTQPAECKALTTAMVSSFHHPPTHEKGNIELHYADSLHEAPLKNSSAGKTHLEMTLGCMIAKHCSLTQTYQEYCCFPYAHR